MTVFDIDDNAGVWFDMEGGGRVKIKALTTGDWRKIRKATTKTVPFVHEHEIEIAGIKTKKFEVLSQDVVDTDSQTLMINDLCIVEWENLFDKNQKPIPCTAENKTVLICMRDPSFRDFVNAKMGILNEATKLAGEASEKN